MRKILAAASAVIVLIGFGTARAEEDKARQPLRLEIALGDGSHVIGIPNIESVPLLTSYAKMDLPLTQILSVTMSNDHATASIYLRNGDKLKGVINLKPIKLVTAFGKVAIDIIHVDGFDVVLPTRALPESLSKGLVLYYSFDHDENGTVADESGHKHDGVALGGVASKSGKFGQAASFDGIDDCIEVPYATDLRFVNQSFSVAAWVLLQSFRPDNRESCFVSNYELDQEVIQIMTYPRSNGQPLAFVTRDSNDQQLDMVAPSNLESGTWVHVAGIRDTQSRQVSLYVNGVLATQASDNRTGDFTPDITGKWRIGAAVFKGLDFFTKGLIDEVRIYDRALSADEILQLQR